MKVCHLISGDLWAGAEAQVYYLVKGVSEVKSFRVTVIIFNDGTLAQKLRSCNIETIIINEQKKKNLGFIFKILRVLINKKPEILHVHGYKEAFFGGIAAKLCGIKTIVRTHHGKGVLESSLKHRLFEFINAHFLIGHSISVSEDLKRYLIQKKIVSVNTVRVIHNGIDETAIIPKKSNNAIREELGISLKSIVVGTLGRMVGVKGHIYFLEGAKEICRQKNNVIFVIAGDGPFKSEALNFVKKENLDDKIKILGFRDDPIDVLNMFDVFTLTSLHEGVPMVLLEAMCLAKPIISSSVGGIPEILTNEVNSLLIEPGDSQAFSQAVQKLVHDREFREKLGQQARFNLLKKHSINILVADVENLYRELI
ncbi:MAG: glycosyltransferase family 4 protein [Chitinivibrionales bacterium]|nr:glycosyltransferase family 4 protein [Chitinivibrionales bacterium]